MDKIPLAVRIRERLWDFRENKKAQLWAMGTVLCILVVILIVAFMQINKKQTPSATPATETINFSDSIDAGNVKEMSRFLDGVKVAAGKENLLPVTIMIENMSSIRPQSGLQAASIVYEALAEGGITRFLAVYSTDQLPSKIGPVRSARSYYVDWAQEYKGLYAHVGGSPQALNQLSSTPELINLEAISSDSKYFFRDSTVGAPHNLFTSAELLAYAIRDKNLAEKQGTFEPWKFQSPQDKKNRPIQEKSISINYYGPDYVVKYNYNREKNIYLRSNGGMEHLDKLTNEQIAVKNVVVKFVPTTLQDATSGRLQMTTTGQGRAVFFRDGEAVEGEWHKDDNADRTKFINQNNEEIKFIPGNIWIEVLPEDRILEYN